MKKSKLCMTATCLLLSLIPLQSKAGIAIPVDTTSIAINAEINAMTTRISEIKAMDKSKLSGPEKRQLRKEVRSIKSRVNSVSGGGVYISVGALLIIILLLILLL